MTSLSGALKKYGVWWLPAGETLGLDWFDNPRGERPEVIDAALRHCGSFDVALDVGAHVGTWAVELSRRFAHTHAFEPVLVTWIALAHNLHDRGIAPERVTPWMAAVGDRMGNCCPVMMANATMSSYVDPSKGGLVPMLALDAVRWSPEGSSVSPASSGGGQLKVSLLKIDVEGGEWHVLAGAERLLEAHHPTLAIEWKPPRLNRYGDYERRIVQLLAKHGYRLAEQLEIDRIYV